MDLLIFDLDGTLIDSQLDLAHSVNAARAHMGFTPLGHHIIATYVGNGSRVLIERAMGEGAAEADIEKAHAYFLQYYREHMLDHTKLYPGVREALEEFRRKGITMAVLTNKPVRFSQAIIDGLGLGDHFFRVYGGNSFEQKKPHRMGVDKLIGESGAARERTLMVGDSGVDVKTARNASIPVAGVTWGFQPEGFDSEPPDVLVDEMEELVRYVLR
ncbi:MAG: HAD-IA family hydrolase [Bryobacteraceae bacterium]|nr:HAD-IA family hydrolase [Bryobacteraceae bacterium]